MPYSKKILYVTLFLALLTPRLVKANDDNKTLILSGAFIYNKSNLGGVVVKIIQDSVIKDVFVTGRSGKFKVFLDYKTMYILEFSKEGFVTQKVEFLTKLPNSVYERDASSFYLQEEFEMFLKYPGIDISFFNDNYIDRFKWEQDEYHFVKDKKYEEKIHRHDKIKAIGSEQNLYSSKIFDQKIKKADSLFNSGDLEKAIVFYSQAFDIKTKDKYSKSRIKQISRDLVSSGEVDEKYTLVISKANELLGKNEFGEARESYQNALIYREGDPFALEKIHEIDSLISYRFLKKVNDYDGAITNGNNLIKSGKYISAKAEFERAGSILPENNEHIIKLQELEQKIEDAGTLKAENVQMESEVEEGDKIQEDTIPEGILQTRNDKPETELVEQTKLPESSLEITSGIAPPENKNLLENTKPAPGTVDATSSQKGEDNSEGPQNEAVIPDSSAYIDYDEMLQGYLQKVSANKKEGNQSALSKNLKNIGNIYHSEENISKAIDYYEESYKILSGLHDTAEMANVISEIAVALYDSGLYDMSVERFEKAVEFKKITGDMAGASEMRNEIGIIYETTYQYDKAIQNYFESLKLLGDKEDSNAVFEVLNNIADVYYQQNELELSLANYQRAFNTVENADNDEAKGELLNDIGVTLYELGRYDEAIGFYEKSLALKEKTNNKIEASMTLNNLGNIRLNWNEYRNAINYYEKSIAIKEEIQYRSGIAVSLFNIANAYEKQNEYGKAIEYYKRSEQEAETNGANKKILSRVFSCLARVYEKTNQFQSAYAYQSKYISNGVFDGKSRELISEKYDRFDHVQSKKEIKYLKRKIQRQKIIAEKDAAERQRVIDIKNLEIKNKIADNKRQKILLYLLASLGLFVAFIAISVYTILQNKKKANRELQQKNELISSQSNHIKDSIMYASKIQTAALPGKEQLDQLLGDYFIFNKPLDIVSGDFFWLSRQDENIVLSVADCTGHGVPGAMLCMLGISFLDEVVKGKNIKGTDQILNTMRHQVINLLHQKGELTGLSDGIDMALCSFNADKSEVCFSGANNPLYIIRENELVEIKADRMPVGYGYKSADFSMQRIKLKKGDMLYMFSDGYMDQMGGENRTRFMRKRFKQLLVSINNEPLNKQRELLQENLDEWMHGQYQQIDDILVVGFRV